MPSLQQIAPRDHVKGFTPRLEAEVEGQSVKVDLALQYYRNRISLAPIDALISEEDADDLSEQELDAIKSASTLCHYLRSWDLEGPLWTNAGEQIVAAGEVIPLDPRIVQHIATPVIGEIMRQLTEEVFPTAKPSRNARRRSR